MIKSIITLTGIALLMIGCNGSKTTTASTGQPNSGSMEILSQAKWQLVELEGKTIDQSTMEKKIQFDLNVVDGTITGFSGCNTFRGNYSAEKGNRISFTQLASTRMACPDNSINENEVLNVFNLADNFTISGDTLILNKGKRFPLAIFKKISKENQIVEKYWKLKVLNGKEVEMAENQEREIYFMLKKQENRITGFSGCNTFGGSYTLEEGSHIQFSNLLSTLRACPNVDINESIFLKVFERADTYTLNGETLLLSDGNRAPMAVFEAVYFN